MKQAFEPIFTEVDTKFSIIINKILELGSIKILSKEEKYWIAVYVAVQKIRTRNVREILKSINNDLCNKIKEKEINPANGNGFDDVKTDEEIKKASIYNLSSIKEYIPNILNKYWILFKSDSNFWISDNPVGLQNKINNDTVRGTIGLKSIWS